MDYDDENDFSVVDLQSRVTDQLNEAMHGEGGSVVGRAINATRQLIARWQEVGSKISLAPYRVHFDRLERLHAILNPFASPDAAELSDRATLEETRQQLRKFFAETREYGALSFEAFDGVARLANNAIAQMREGDSDIPPSLKEAMLTPTLSERNEGQQEMSRLAALRGQFEAVERNYKSYLRLATATEARWIRFCQRVRLEVAAREYRPALMNVDRLALRDEQERFVSLDHNGAFRLQGTAGSGKTVVLLHRALRLAQEDRNAFVGVFTVSRALADHLRETLCTLAGESPERIVVASFYDRIYEYVRESDPEVAASLRLNDPLSGERVAEATWRDFVNKRGRTEQANVFAIEGPGSLLAWLRQRNIDAMEFLRQEMVYILSGYPPERREEYLSDYRRSRPLMLSRPHKEACLRIAERWEEYMQAGGLSDIEGLMLEAYRLFGLSGQSKAGEGALLRFKHVLVDEYQDFSSVELQLLRAISVDADGPNALFVAGDSNQKVLPKHHNTARAGFNFQGRGAYLRANLRNTQEILRAAYNLPQLYPPQADQDDEAVIPIAPELSPYSGGRPVALHVPKYKVRQLVSSIVRLRRGVRVAILSFDQKVLSAIQDDLEKAIGRDSVFRIQTNDELDRWLPQSTSGGKGVFLADFIAAKGFEFDTVVTLDLSAGVYPAPEVQGNYLWREAARLYVAMTRARDELLLLYTEQPSEFIDAMREDVVFDEEQDPFGFVDKLLRNKS